MNVRFSIYIFLFFCKTQRIQTTSTWSFLFFPVRTWRSSKVKGHNKTRRSHAVDANICITCNGRKHEDLGTKPMASAKRAGEKVRVQSLVLRAHVTKYPQLTASEPQFLLLGRTERWTAGDDTWIIAVQPCLLRHEWSARFASYLESGRSCVRVQRALALPQTWCTQIENQTGQTTKIQLQEERTDDQVDPCISQDEGIVWMLGFCFSSYVSSDILSDHLVEWKHQVRGRS